MALVQMAKVQKSKRSGDEVEKPLVWSSLSLAIKGQLG